jgi:predicted  nucleic acid-binding Zn-ribbon protein
MSTLKRICVLAAMAAAMLIAGTPAHDNEFSDLRSLVDKTQSDLRNASDLQHGNKQNDRYHKAQDHLSKLDRSLSHGKYNKGALNDSIDVVKSILDHNTLQASARDALARDLTELKVARDRH